MVVPEIAIFEKMQAAVRDRDVDAYLALLDEDSVFVRHQSGTTMSRLEFAEIIRKMMVSEQMEMGERRCIYENDAILVGSSINSYPDGTR